MTPATRTQLVDFAAKSRLPAMFMNRDYVAAGGLMSYAPDFSEVFRHAAAPAIASPAGGSGDRVMDRQPLLMDLPRLAALRGRRSLD
jgi:putative tryptophan/tyrosine transport system substrate-binding protein